MVVEGLSLWHLNCVLLEGQIQPEIPCTESEMINKITSPCCHPLLGPEAQIF